MSELTGGKILPALFSNLFNVCQKMKLHLNCWRARRGKGLIVMRILFFSFVCFCFCLYLFVLGVGYGVKRVHCLIQW